MLVRVSNNATRELVSRVPTPRAQQHAHITVMADLRALAPHAIDWVDMAPRSVQHFNQSLSRSSCALVGSSESLLGRRLGHEIDSADVVVRVNKVVTGVDHGERTDIWFSKLGQWFSSSEICKDVEHPNKFCIRRLRDVEIRVPARCCTPSSTNGQGHELHSAVPSTPPVRTPQRSCVERAKPGQKEMCSFALCPIATPPRAPKEPWCPAALRAFVGRHIPEQPEFAARATVLTQHAFSREQRLTGSVAIGHQTAASFEAMLRALHAASPHSLCRNEDHCTIGRTHLPTTGMHAFATFAALCRSLTVYGFTGLPDKYTGLQGEPPCVANYSGGECYPLEHRVQAAWAAAAPQRLRIVR